MGLAEEWDKHRVPLVEELKQKEELQIKVRYAAARPLATEQHACHRNMETAARIMSCLLVKYFLCLS